ncbi:MAG: hypothetical protein SGPRY_000712 [Prymnesium sp.]
MPASLQSDADDRPMPATVARFARLPSKPSGECEEAVSGVPLPVQPASAEEKPVVVVSNCSGWRIVVRVGFSSVLVLSGYLLGVQRWRVGAQPSREELERRRGNWSTSFLGEGVNVRGQYFSFHPTDSETEWPTRFVFVAGLEGTGHHAVGAMWRACGAICTHDQQLTSMLWNGKEQAKSAMLVGTVVAEDVSARDVAEDYEHRRKAFISRLRLVRRKHPGKLVLLNCFKTDLIVQTGEMSYPNFGGEDRPIHNPNLIVIAELAALAGVELRILVLDRPARELLISTSVHRKFGSIPRQAAILATSAAVLAAQLGQVDVALYQCVPYRQLGDRDWWSQRRDGKTALQQSISVWLHPSLSMDSPFLAAFLSAFRDSGTDEFNISNSLLASLTHMVSSVRRAAHCQALQDQIVGNTLLLNER